MGEFADPNGFADPDGFGFPGQGGGAGDGGEGGEGQPSTQTQAPSHGGRGNVVRRRPRPLSRKRLLEAVREPEKPSVLESVLEHLVLDPAAAQAAEAARLAAEAARAAELAAAQKAAEAEAARLAAELAAAAEAVVVPEPVLAPESIPSGSFLGADPAAAVRMLEQLFGQPLDIAPDLADEAVVMEAIAIIETIELMEAC